SENAWLWLASISEYPEELLVFLNNVLDINPQNERALQWSGSTKTLLSKTLVQRGIDANEDGRREFAMQCFDQALSYDNRNVTAWLWLASLADSESRKMEYLRHVLMLEPDNETAKSAIAEVDAESRATLFAGAAKAAVAGDASSALAILDKIETRWPDNKEAWIVRSHLAVAFEDKMAAWSRVLEFDPHNQYASASLESLRWLIESATPTVAQQQPEPTPELVATPEPVAFVEPEATPHADEFSGPTHELPPLESIVGSEFSSEATSHVEPTPIPEPAVEQVSSPWDTTVDSDTTESEFNYPTVDAFSLPEEVSNVVSEYQPVVDVTEYAIPTPVEAGESFDAPHEVPMPAEPFEPPVEQSMVEHEPEVADDRVRVLLVDDSATARKLIAGKLEESGYHVLCAENGREAIKMARSSSPAFALVDIGMPMMDGYAVCRSLRDEPATQNVPVVLISGKDGYFEEGRGTAAGASGFITKPFGPETLMKTVQSYLAGAAPNT
ncbi:MAG TPA: response regulator, partial [Pyrinomonadaceae bacterium]|nr:response regulator [Pyrinomonadaceae bacterium]